MSPEYVVFGKFSEKSDIFSFGVILLEIITGKKNNSFHQEGSCLTLIGHVSCKEAFYILYSKLYIHTVYVDSSYLIS